MVCLSPSLRIMVPKNVVNKRDALSSRGAVTCFLEGHTTYFFDVGARAFRVLVAFIAAEENEVANDCGHALRFAFFQIFAVHNNLTTAACALSVAYTFLDFKGSHCSGCQCHMHTRRQHRGLVVGHAEKINHNGQKLNNEPV